MKGMCFCNYYCFSPLICSEYNLLLFTAINSKNYSKYYGYGSNIYGHCFFIFGIPHLQGNGFGFFLHFWVRMSADFHFLWWFFIILGRPKYDIICITVTLGYKERLDSEQPGNSETFSLSNFNLSVYFINSKRPGVTQEQFCDDQKVPYHQVRL